MEGKLYKSPNGEHYYLTVDGKKDFYQVVGYSKRV